MATSTIPAFRSALVAALSAQTALSGVAITDGHPPPDVLAGEEFISLQYAKGAQSVRSLNATTQPRNEQYVQTVVISVVGQTRDDQVTLGNRAFALLAAVENTIRPDVRLAAYYTGAGALYSVVLTDFDYEVYADDSARESRITFGLEVEARL